MSTFFKDINKQIADHDEFMNWYNEIRKIKPYLPKKPEESIDYDYKAFYTKRKDDAIKMLTEPESAHFSDIGKKPSHPTFSNESMYSNSKTPGGEWIDHGGEKWEFKHSEHTMKNSDDTINYLKHNDPNVTSTYKGGVMLNEVTVKPKQ